MISRKQAEYWKRVIIGNEIFYYQWYQYFNNKQSSVITIMYKTIGYEVINHMKHWLSYAIYFFLFLFPKLDDVHALPLI